MICNSKEPSVPLNISGHFPQRLIVCSQLVWDGNKSQLTTYQPIVYLIDWCRQDVCKLLVLPKNIMCNQQYLRLESTRKRTFYSWRLSKQLIHIYVCKEKFPLVIFPLKYSICWSPHRFEQKMIHSAVFTTVFFSALVWLTLRSLLYLPIDKGIETDTHTMIIHGV